MSTVRFFASAIAIVAAVSTQINLAAAATTYSTGFEDFTLGPMSSSAVGPTQGGWSGGAVGGFVNNDTGDEQIVDTEVHTGDQSWHYARGYNSPGSGTPYTPNLSDAVDNVGDSMSGAIWFKAHTAADNSLLAIETGNIAGTDRAEILAYIDNIAGGLTVRSFTNGPTFDGVPIASGLDASVWHELSFSLSRTASENAVSISIDGGTPVSFNGSLKGFRDSLLQPYSESSRLKLRTRHTDGDLSFNGFYLDDISYSVSAAIPEPTSIALFGLAAGSLVVVRRRRRA